MKDYDLLIKLASHTRVTRKARTPKTERAVNIKRKDQIVKDFTQIMRESKHLRIYREFEFSIILISRLFNYFDRNFYAFLEVRNLCNSVIHFWVCD
jgi:hypothetical protein